MSLNAMVVILLALELPNTVASSVNSLKFSQHWPETFCISQRAENKACLIPKDVNYWTIHGLWPEAEMNCTGREFNWTYIQNMKKDLDLFWTDFFHSKHYFWKHEWDAHGKCTTPIKSLANQTLYFRNTLALRQSLKKDMYRSLKACDIKPDSRQTYKRKYILRCLKEALGVDVVITCSDVKHKVFLLEIRVCLDKALNVKDCQSVPNVGCPSNGIRYPPIQHQPQSGLNNEDGRLIDI